MSNAYVETLSTAEAQRAISVYHRKPLKGRLVHVHRSSQDELLKALFSSWEGEFRRGMAIPPESPAVSTRSGYTFINRQEINSLLTICRNYKVRYRTTGE